MRALVLDTTVLIDALRGRPAAARLRDLVCQREILLTTAVNVEEIIRGCGRVSSTQRTRCSPRSGCFRCGSSTPGEPERGDVNTLLAASPCTKPTV